MKEAKKETKKKNVNKDKRGKGKGVKNGKVMKTKDKINQTSKVQLPDSNWKKFLAEQKNIDKKVVKKRPRKSFSKKEPQKETNDAAWLDDVDPLLLEQECGVKLNKETTSKKDSTVENVSISSTSHLKDETVVDDPEKMTKYVALDCEMVGVGLNGEENALARVSLVNSNCECIYDKFVKPAEKVVDYRTHVSGIRPSDVKDAPSYELVQKEVSDILKDRILVGHALHNDLKCLMLGHSKRQIRDTSKYKPFHKLMQTKRPALRKLVAKILHEEIQSGEHSSVIDAKATMKIFKLYRKEWEKAIYSKKAKEEMKEIFIGKKDPSARKKRRFSKNRRFRNK